MKLQKETKSPKRHGKWYDDACGTAFALELIGERWSLLIVRELMLGGRRFSELRGGLPGLSAKVLTERLENLEDVGVLTRRQLPPPASVQIYELTPWGYAAEPAMRELGRWAAQSPGHDPTLPLSAASLMISLRTMVDLEKAQGDFAGALHIGADRFFVTMNEHGFVADRGGIERPDFVLTSPDAPPIAAMVYGKVPAEALADRGLVASGDSEALQRFLNLFALPPKYGPQGQRPA